MRIMWWAERFWPFVGGIETLGLAVIPELQAMGHEVIVVTSHSLADLSDTDCHQSIPIRRFHFNTALQNQDLRQLLQTRRALSQFKKQFKPDVTHIHFSGASPLFHWQTGGGCTLLTLHSLPTAGNGGLVQKSVAQADWVTGVSTHILGQVSADPACSSVVYNGVVAPEIAPDPLPKEPVFLCIGRFVAWKRFDWAIERFANLLTIYPEAQLVIVGDGAERENLQQHVQRLGIQDRVTFTGMLSQPELHAQINRATALLVPSTAMENIPYTAVEASWLGRSVIASNVSGLPEIVVDGETGFLVAPEDANGWLMRMRELIEHPQLAQTLGNNARSHVRARFALNRCVAEYTAIYRQLGGTA